ncbi:MAG: superoxide dismutase [Chloroflexi bacterium]|jgi:muconolactone delta-isomerase|nr:muconolactone Delta-isomerase family protein [Anaerolineaceae bacterium]NMB86729.1 superoxide dismutase [Chloroflexota bacterium]
MKIIAIEHELPGANQEQFQAHAHNEAARVWELYQAGLLRELYFRADQSTAVLVLECANVEEARQTLSTLPLVARGLIEFELLPLAPYPGFARLFLK